MPFESVGDSFVETHIYLSDEAVHVQIIGFEHFSHIGCLRLPDQVFKLINVNETIVVGITNFNDCL